MTKKKKHHRPFHSRLPVMTLLIGYGLPLAFVTIGIVLWYGAYSERANTEHADGIVVGFEEMESRPDSDGKGGGISYRPIVEFVVADNKFRCSSGAYSGTNYWTIGEHLPVRYDPDNPHRAFIASFYSHWLAPFFLILVGAFFLFFIVVGSLGGSSTTPSKDPRVWWWQFIAGQVCCMALLCPGLVLLLVAYRQDSDTETVTGTVVEIRDKVVYGSTYYRPIVEYKVEGKRYECDDLEWSGLKTLHPGSSVAIRYRTGHPEGVVNSSAFSHWAAALCLIVFGTSLEIATIVYLIRQRRGTTRTTTSP